MVVFDSKCFNTLRKSCPLTYNISPFGGDKREGAGVENYFFNSLLESKVNEVSRMLGWFRGISRHRRSILTYLIVAFCLFAYMRFRTWQNWETAASQWYLLEP